MCVCELRPSAAPVCVCVQTAGSVCVRSVCPDENCRRAATSSDKNTGGRRTRSRLITEESQIISNIFNILLLICFLLCRTFNNNNEDNNNEDLMFLQTAQQTLKYSTDEKNFDAVLKVC